MSDNKDLRMTNAKTLTAEQEEDMIRQIGMAVQSLEWFIATPIIDGPNDPIPGMIIGTKDFLEAVLEKIKKGEEQSD